jgi:ribosomal protein S17E
LFYNCSFNQKTGHKKLNKYDDVFSKKVNKNKPNIDYMANEYSYEVLTKAHSYDISGELHEASSLTLLSQLVNAVSFGGLSNLTSKNLQNAMGGRMTINSLRIGRDLSNVAIKFQALPEETNRTRFDKIIARFIEGNVSTTGLTGPEKAAYDTVLRAGVYEMANLAFQRQILYLYTRL